MLKKGQTAFNFNNVCQSLYDLYLSHLGRGVDIKAGGYNRDARSPATVDPDSAKRMMIVKKSKSSLLIPLLVPFRPSGGVQEDDSPLYNTGIRVPEFRLVGSLEFYKYHF